MDPKPLEEFVADMAEALIAISDNHARALQQLQQVSSHQSRVIARLTERLTVAEARIERLMESPMV